MTSATGVATEPVIERGGECDCADAEDLLRKLSPMDNAWQPDPSAWIFRGQGHDLPLLPKAYRPGADPFVACGIAPRMTLQEEGKPLAPELHRLRALEWTSRAIILASGAA